MNTPRTSKALNEFKALAARQGATESDLIQATNDLVQKMAKLETELAAMTKERDAEREKVDRKSTRLNSSH